MDASTTNCVGTGFASSTSDISYLDWLVVNSWIIFLLAFVPLGFFFSLFKKSRQ